MLNQQDLRTQYEELSNQDLLEILTMGILDEEEAELIADVVAKRFPKVDERRWRRVF